MKSELFYPHLGRASCYKEGLFPKTLLGSVAQPLPIQGQPGDSKELQTLLLHLELLAGFLSPPGCLSQHSLPVSLCTKTENPFILDHRRDFKDHLIPTPYRGQGCPKLCPTPRHIPHLLCHSPSLLQVTADRGHQAQAALQISAFLFPSVLRCQCSGECL